MDYDRTCFAIMPFGAKPVTLCLDGETVERTVDFDDLYDRLFAPAIEAAVLPEGGHLVPRRTDRDFFSGVITEEMFDYIQHARFALADVSGLNANVFYELGVRHSTRATGTAIFRQAGAPLPFDIRQVKAFDYAAEPDWAEASRALVTRVLTESLANGRVDSPVQTALRQQRAQPEHVQTWLREAEDAIRAADWAGAATRLAAAVDARPRDPVLRLKLGLMRKKLGDWVGALPHFEAAVAHAPDYAEAHRELGIAQNKLYHRRTPPAGPTGQAALERAVALNPDDHDALASLGGVLVRQGDFEGALARYRDAAERSGGDSYPLLNALKLEARLRGRLEIGPAERFQLRRVERTLEAQVGCVPPYDTPWCYFDLAEVRLYLGDTGGFLRYAEEGMLACGHRGEAASFHGGLRRLLDGGVAVEGLAEGLRLVEAQLPYLPE